MNKQIKQKWGEQDCREILGATEFTQNSKPVVIKWFKERGIKILKIGAGLLFCVCQATDAEGKLAFYVVSFKRDNKSFYGGAEAVEKLHSDWIMKLKINAD